MLLINSKTCIKTNGFVSNYFSVSGSALQGCSIAPILYCIQAKPIACTIRADPQIEGIKIPGEFSVTESKISIFANDTQLMNRNEKSAENSFKIFHVNELASGV